MTVICNQDYEKSGSWDSASRGLVVQPDVFSLVDTGYYVFDMLHKVFRMVYLSVFIVFR